MTQRMETTVAKAGWTVGYDATAEGRLAKLLGVRRPTRNRTLRKQVAAYLCNPSTDPWSTDEMVGQGDRTIDVGLDALLRHHGVQPDAMLLLSLMGAVPELRHGVHGQDVSLMPKENITPHVRGRAWIAPGIQWDSLQAQPFIHLRHHALPETLAAGAAGKPLTALLSHPALDSLDIRIDAIPYTGDWTRVMLKDVPMMKIDPSRRRGEGDTRC